MEAAQPVEAIDELPPGERPQGGGQLGGSLLQDVDGDALLGVLDVHSRGLRQDLLAYFLQLKEAQLRQRAVAVEAQRAECAATLAGKQGELEGALAAGEGQRARAARLTAALERAVYRLYKRDQLRKCWALLARAWRAWREHTARQRRIARGLVAAARHYNMGRLRDGAFRAWRRVAHTGHRERLKAENAAVVKASQHQIWQEANAANKQLSQRVAELESELAEERTARAKLEEDMKRAFMRGVCALNIEAMALMKNGAPPGAAAAFAGLPSQAQAAQQSEPTTGCCPVQPTGCAPPPAAANPMEHWLISTVTAPHVAAESWPRSYPLLAKPAPLQGCLGPYSSSPAAVAQWEPQAEQQPLLLPPGSAQLASPAAAAMAAVLSKPAVGVPYPAIKVAPTLPLDLPAANFPNLPLAERERSPSRFTHPAVTVPSNLRSNVPEHIAEAMAARPQTAAAGQPQARPPPQSESRRPATTVGGLSQRSKAAKKGGGPVVVRGAASQQQVTAQEAAARRGMQLPGQPGER